jgi:hypothetical protein
MNRAQRESTRRPNILPRPSSIGYEHGQTNHGLEATPTECRKENRTRRCVPTSSVTGRQQVGARSTRPRSQTAMRAEIVSSKPCECPSANPANSQSSLKRGSNGGRVGGVEIRLVAASAAHRQICWFRDLRRAAKHGHLFRLPLRNRTATCRGVQSTLDKTERQASIFSGSTASDQDEYMPVRLVPFVE